MNTLLPIAYLIHLLSAALWVGGMFFAYRALRPAAAQTLEPPERLMLWSATFTRFFPWVWLFVIVLPLTGYWMALQIYDGLGNMRLHVYLMQALGIPMILLYMHLFFAPFRRLQRAVAATDWKEAGRNLDTIRKLVGINLALGIAVILIAGSGRYGGLF